MHPLFRRCRHPHPVHGCSVRNGSAPPALAAVVADDLPFGRAVKRQRQRIPSGRALSSGGQSVPNINCTVTSSVCLSALLVSVIIVVGVILPKCPSQSWRSATFKKSHAYSPASASASSLSLSSSSSSSLSFSVATLLPLLPSQSSRPMNHDDINHALQSISRVHSSIPKASLSAKKNRRPLVNHMQRIDVLKDHSNGRKTG